MREFLINKHLLTFHRYMVKTLWDGVAESTNLKRIFKVLAINEYRNATKILLTVLVEFSSFSK